MFTLNKQNFLTLIFFIFPVLLVSISHAGSFIFLVVALSGLVFYFYDKTRPKLNADEKQIIFSFLAFFILSLISVTYQYIENGYFYDDANDKIEKYLKLGSAVFVFSSALCIKNPLTIIKYSLLCSAIVYGLYSLVDRFYYHVLAHGVSHHLVFGYISNLILASLVIFLLFEKEKEMRILLIIASLFAFVATVLSGARGAWVVWPILLVFFFFVIKEHRKRIGIASVGLIFSFVVMYLLPFTGVEKRINEGLSDVKVYMQGKEIRSIGSRFEMWKASIAVIKTSPILGVGVGGYKESIHSVTANRIAERYYSPHNVYLNALMTQGVVGLTALLFVLFAPMRVFYKYINLKNQSVRMAAIIGMVVSLSYSIYGMTGTVFDGNALSMFYVYLIVMLLVHLRIHSGDVASHES